MTDKAQAERSPEKIAKLLHDLPEHWPYYRNAAVPILREALHIAESRGRERGIEEAAQNWREGLVAFGLTFYPDGYKHGWPRDSTPLRALLAGHKVRVLTDEHGNCLACGSYAHGYASDKPTAGPSDSSSVAAAETPEET